MIDNLFQGWLDFFSFAVLALGFAAGIIALLLWRQDG